MELTQIAVLLVLSAILVAPLMLLWWRGRKADRVIRIRKCSLDVSAAYGFAPLSPYAVERISSDREPLLDWLDETRRRMKGLFLWHLKVARRNFRFNPHAELGLLGLYLRLLAVAAYLRLNVAIRLPRSERRLAAAIRLEIGLVDALWSRYNVLLIEMAHLQSDRTPN